MDIKFLLISSAKFMLLLILINGCQVKELSPFEKAKNPYAQLGVEGYMGSAMTSCLGIPSSGPPIRRKKDGGTVVNDQPASEQSSYFDCVDRQIQEVERIILDKESE